MILNLILQNRKSNRFIPCQRCQMTPLFTKLFLEQLDPTLNQPIIAPAPGRSGRRKGICRPCMAALGTIYAQDSRSLFHPSITKEEE
jgi:hypothetical protein